MGETGTEPKKKKITKLVVNIITTVVGAAALAASFQNEIQINMEKAKENTNFGGHRFSCGCTSSLSLSFSLAVLVFFDFVGRTWMQLECNLNAPMPMIARVQRSKCKLAHDSNRAYVCVRPCLAAHLSSSNFRNDIVPNELCDCRPLGLPKKRPDQQPNYTLAQARSSVQPRERAECQWFIICV